ncbi:helix-turn-helix domain-containing protein [Amycolatopsis sp. NBC_01480]|uniref:helix-turn-helix domain-containing protein n=1 Tax=Amycolatopsis sp. NBC_01480 TaxID=2903562 RepID=UPI002E280754|nr:helix-turn-helix domain-containing protein [Amycolatopsis sp. NBC_01480]
MLRQWHDQHETQPGTADPAIAAALRQIHEHPEHAWTVARLGRGARLLRETDASLAIARQVGYSTEFALSSAFRREYGVAPGRFRQAPTATLLNDGGQCRGTGMNSARSGNGGTARA